MKIWLIAIGEYHFPFRIYRPYRGLKSDGTPTSFSVYKRFFFAFDEIKLFDFFMKSKIPTP
jgi:hypothetical protein